MKKKFLRALSILLAFTLSINISYICFSAQVYKSPNAVKNKKNTNNYGILKPQQTAPVQYNQPQNYYPVTQNPNHTEYQTPNINKTPAQYVAPNAYSKSFEIEGANQTGAEEILIIMDYSGSMDYNVSGEKKIDIAKRALSTVLNKLPIDKKIGFRVYGHEADLLYCSASELICPIRSNNKACIITKSARLKPTGATPIIYSLKQALATDFSYNAKKRIILITDGAETCDGSLCDFALGVVRAGNNVKIDVISFSIDDLDAIDQLKCVAMSTKANFYNANTAAELIDSLNKSFEVRTQVEGKILY